MKKYPLTLVLGGAASGKSEFAEKLAGRLGRNIVYLATAVPAGSAAATREWKDKISRHRLRRPKSWRTELLNGRPLAGLIGHFRPEGILLDSLTLWVSRRFRKLPAADLESSLLLLIDHLRLKSPVIVVSDEVGLGLVPMTRPGRRFLETLGRINARISNEADTVFFVVAGQSIRIKDRPMTAMCRK